jgi:RNA recognition motif-containing protein
VTDRNTGAFRGFGYVTMGSPEEARKATEIEDKTLNGKLLRIELQRERGNTTGRDGAQQNRGAFGAGGGRDQANPNPNDWACGVCGANNFGKRETCFRRDCGAAKGTVGEGGPPKPKYNRDQSDWACLQCGANNFGKRDTCFKKECGAARGDAKAGLPPKDIVPVCFPNGCFCIILTL